MQGKTGAPGGTRTPDLPLRRRLLYPAELLAHIISHLDFTWINGAGDGNRTHTTSLEGWDSTIELHPQNSKPTIAILLHFSQKVKRLFQFFPPRLPRSRKTKPEQLRSKTYWEVPYPRCLHIIKQIQRYVKHFHQKN